MYLIGLTGNIASGKSIVRRMLEELGARTIDADALAHAALLKGTPTWRAVVDAFGYDVLRADGSVDRQKLGARVFAGRALLQRLESIVHPAVSTQLALLLRDADEPIVVIEAIKLVEAGLHQSCDALWVVTAPPTEQKRRLIEDRGMSELDAQLRLRAQPPLDEKLKLARVIIDNGGRLEATRVQVERAFAAIDPATATDKTSLLATLLGLSPKLQEEKPARAATPSSIPIESQQQESRAPHEPVSWIGEPIQDRRLTTRRARPGDAAILGRWLAEIEGAAEPLERGEVLQRLGKWGYWIGEADGKAVALVAWHADNLVAVIRELWTRSPKLAAQIFPMLLARVEEEAEALKCEVVTLITNPQNEALVRAVTDAQGYAESKLDELHPIWHQVAKESLQPGDLIYLKRLREQIATKPF